MNTQPTYALSSGTPRWALDPYRFPGLAGLDADEAPADTDTPSFPRPGDSPQRSAR
ncbi:hypothetical protein [Streptomyces sp. NPDC059564]|uniref:hypothetical protein n=1 Tax=Streptomyces sp. NPDC059564 TaxID=3346865 RepID=UPI0036741DB4